jgi:uncharacterized protein (TIGR03437 family)
MIVRYQSLMTFRGQVNVAPASPGIFALDASGKGGGAILNQDTSVNSPQNPAAKGSVIVLYATGGGQTNPPGRDGQIANAPNLPAPVLPVKVRIGGVESQVQYAGAAPGFIAGAMQINVRVPETAPSGNVPVILEIGGWPSQEGLTVAIR